MKSKSFDLKRNSSEKIKLNKTFDFSKYYTSAAETKTVLEQSPENHVKENKSVNKKLDLPSKREHSPKKKKTKLEPLDISHIDIEGPSLNATAARNTSLNESKLTSTPRTSVNDNTPKVKSIMKNKLVTNSDEHLDASPYSPNKPKKRNKSVSFMLEDTEEVVVKKTKSNDSNDRKQDTPKKHVQSKDLSKLKKLKFNKTDVKGKENKRNDNTKAESEDKEKVKKSEKFKDDKINSVSSPKPVSSKEKREHKKDKLKKVKKQNSEEKMEDDGEKEESNNSENQAENKNRRAKKKKHSPKQNTETEMEGEPAAKSQKKEIKPEAIVENLESLSIGDNAHTLTNLLDEMTVAEKDKRKKHKRTLKKVKKHSSSTSSGDTGELEKIEEGKERVKWQKRKWNKDKKGDADNEGKSSIIVDNLPLSILCNYKKQLVEHFKKHGEVKSVGVAEMYPAEDSKPVFTTTIHFNNKEAASEALKEDQAEVCGSRVRVRAPLPATETTLVVRSYAELTDQSVSSAFAAAGRVRSIRNLVKGKKAIATAFVEFDGPDALQKALQLGESARIAGKKVHVSRFEARRKHKPPPAADKASDSEDSD